MNTIRPALWLALALVAGTVSGAITGNDRGTGANSTTEAATVMSPTSTIAAGSAGILSIAADNAAAANATNFPASVTDSVGNVWIAKYDGPSAASAGGNLERAIYLCDSLTTPLTSSNNLTITYTAASVTAKAWAFVEAVPAVAGNICSPAITGTVINTGTTASGIQAAGTGSTVASAGSLVGDICIGMMGAESADLFVGDADTSNGSWSTMQHTGTGSGATGMSICVQYKIQTTASSTQTYNPTFSSGTSDNGVATLTLAEVPPKTRARLSNSTGETTSTVTFQKGIAAGSIAVLCWGGKNNGNGGATSNLPSTLTDSKSNTWTLNANQNGIYDPGVAGVGAELGTYTSTITTPLVVGDTITITYTFANAASKCIAVFEFSDATAYATGNVGTGNSTGSNTVTTTSIANGDYVIGLAAAQLTNAWTPDTDTLNGSWSSPVVNEATNSTAIAQYKKVTASGAQTYDSTLTATANMIQWTELTVPAAAGGGATTKIGNPAHPSIPSI